MKKKYIISHFFALIVLTLSILSNFTLESAQAPKIWQCTLPHQSISGIDCTEIFNSQEAYLLHIDFMHHKLFTSANTPLSARTQRRYSRQRETSPTKSTPSPLTKSRTSDSKFIFPSQETIKTPHKKPDTTKATTIALAALSVSPKKERHQLLRTNRRFKLWQPTSALQQKTATIPLIFEN